MTKWEIKTLRGRLDAFFDEELEAHLSERWEIVPSLSAVLSEVSEAMNFPLRVATLRREIVSAPIPASQPSVIAESAMSLPLANAIAEWHEAFERLLHDWHAARRMFFLNAGESAVKTAYAALLAHAKAFPRADPSPLPELDYAESERLRLREDAMLTAKADYEKDGSLPIAVAYIRRLEWHNTALTKQLWAVRRLQPEVTDDY